MIPAELKKLLAFGSGVGIQIVRTKSGNVATEALHVAAVRVRPNGARLLDSFTVEDFRNQPAGQWGATYAAFLRKLGMKQAVAVVLLPRADVFLRALAMPGVSDKDLDNAVRFQIDGFNPYKEDDAVYSAWSRLPGTDAVLVALARRQAVESYEDLFEEAGVRVLGFTCSAAAIYSALRLFGAKPVPELLAVDGSGDHLEFYGESPARPLFAAGSSATPERAAAELQTSAVLEPVPLSTLIQAEPALPFAAALASACPLLSLPLNLLPAERRKASSRLRWAPTAVLGAGVLALAGALVAFPAYEQRKYVKSLEVEIAAVSPKADRGAAIDKQVATLRSRIQLLDDLRRHPKADMDVIAELTRVLNPPTWVNFMQISPKQVIVGGETQEAAPLLQLLDASHFFEASEFQASPIRITGGEQFRIKTNREGVPATVSGGLK